MARKLTDCLVRGDGRLVLGIAVCVGGLLGLFTPRQFAWFFGFDITGPTATPLLQLVGLGVFCGGFMLWEKSLAETLVIAGFWTAAIFLLNFGMGYPLAMALLVGFPSVVCVFGLKTLLERKSK